MDSQSCLSRTKWAYILTRAFDTPFWGIFNMLPFILYKDLHATPFQLAMLITLKPLVSIFSSYWSVLVNNRRDRLVSNILCARLLAALPFLFFPWIHEPWFFVAAFGFYMMLAVGVVPAWMEILKLNLPDKVRESVFSNMQTFGYLGAGLLPFILGGMLDEYSQAWRWMFPFAALLGLAACFFQYRIHIAPEEIEKPFSPTIGITHHLLKPWKSAWSLLKKRPDFSKFQIGFMLIGSGLMIMQPMLTIFFVDELHLSYTELAVALTLCKGAGFAVGSPLWSKWIHRINIYRLCSIIAALACLFPFGLICAKSSLLFLYGSYFIYGFMQSGNELAWNLSGPLFAKQEDSTAFTSINVAAVGVRGCFVPFLSGLICSFSSSAFVMVLGGVICILATLRFALYSRKVPIPAPHITLEAAQL